RRELAGHSQVKHSRGVRQGQGRGGYLDDVRVQLIRLLGDVLNIRRSGLEVVIADDPLGLAEPANLAGDVLFQVNVIHTQGNRLAEQLQALFFVAAPEPAIDAPADREDHGGGALLEDPLQVRIPAQAID